MRLRYLTPIVASLVMVAAVLCARRHRSESVESAEIPLPAPYLKVLAAMGKKSSFESVLESGGARLVSRSWDEFKFDLRDMPRLSSWEMKGRGKFRVVSASGDFPGEMELEQVVSADRGGISVESNTTRPCGPVRDQRTTTAISNSRPPVLKIESRMVYERLVPFWMADEVDDRVSKHNKGQVESMKAAVVSIVQGHPENTAHQ